jgi:hypothetical protein
MIPPDKQRTAGDLNIFKLKEKVLIESNFNRKIVHFSKETKRKY